MCVPKLAELFSRSRENDEILMDGSNEAILSTYAIPIKLKYDGPSLSKFGKDAPLWKTTMTCSLKVIKEIGPQIDTLGSSMDFF